MYCHDFFIKDVGIYSIAFHEDGSFTETVLHGSDILIF